MPGQSRVGIMPAENLEDLAGQMGRPLKDLKVWEAVWKDGEWAKGKLIKNYGEAKDA